MQRPREFSLSGKFDEIAAGYHVTLPRTHTPKDATTLGRISAVFGWPNVFRFRGSVVPRLTLPLIVYGSWAAFVTILRQWLDRNHEVTFTFTSQFLISLSIVVGMILAFRTNTAYERFREGRQTICDLQVSLRNLKRIFMRSEFFAGGKQEATRALHLLPAFFISVTRRLRNEEDAPGTDLDDFEGIISEVQTSHIRDIRRVPTVIIDRLFDFAAQQARLHATPAMGYVTSLTQAFTNLERIRGTPIPSAYDIHLAQVVTVYLLFFPLAINNWWAVPTTLFAAFTLLGVEGIGEEIENPFGYDWNDLPLDCYVAEFVEEVEYAIADVHGGTGACESSSSLPRNLGSQETVLVDVK